MRGTPLLLTVCCLAGPGLACGTSSSPSPDQADTPTAEVDAALEADAATDVEATDSAPDGTQDVVEPDVVEPDVSEPDVAAPEVITPDVSVADADTAFLDTTAEDTQDAMEDADTAGPVDTVDAEVEVPEPTVVSLIDNMSWSLVAEDDDPFVVDGGAVPDLCPESEIQPEDTPDGVWLDVKTEGCAWATLQQPLLHAVAAGDQVRVTVVHFEIYAGDTDYTLAVALGEEAETIWTETVEIGAGFELIEGLVTPTMDHPEGAPVWYHVSNHGENTWSLVGIDLLVP